jgi:hypothetical protein
MKELPDLCRDHVFAAQTVALLPDSSHFGLYDFGF